MRKISDLELQPHVHLFDVGFGDIQNIRILPDIVAQFKNYGSTSALGVTIKAGWSIRIPTERPMIRLRDCPVTVAIPPNAIITVVVAADKTGARAGNPDAMAFLRFELEWKDRAGNRFGIFETYVRDTDPHGNPTFRFYASP
jgi:hypothetical protein